MSKYSYTRFANNGGALLTANQVDANFDSVNYVSQNLLPNGSGALINLGWTGTTFGSTFSPTIGRIFRNSAAISAAGYDESVKIPIAGSSNVVTLGCLYGQSIPTAGTGYIALNAYDSTGTFISQFAKQYLSATASGVDVPVFCSGTSPANTATVTAVKGIDAGSGSTVSIAANSMWFKQLKMELGAYPSSFTDEATMLCFSSQPQFYLTPTFSTTTVTFSGGATNFSLDGDTAQYKNIYLKVAGVIRWAFGADNATETGSNAGTNYRIGRCSDAGALIDTPFSITRATGLITFGSSAGFTSVGPGKFAYSNATVVINDTSASNQAGLYFQANGVNAWNVIGNFSSSSQYAIGRYVAGVYQDQPFVIDNATGNITMTANLTVGGYLNVKGGANAVNNPNLLWNSSAEFGANGWTLSSNLSNYSDTSGGVGTYFTNPTAISAVAISALGNQVPFGPSKAITMSFDCANASTSGSIGVALVAYNSAGTSLGNVASVVPSAGSALQRYTITGTTPANTAYVRPSWYSGGTAPTVAAFGLVLRRIKIEAGSVATLYSTEANDAALLASNGKMLIGSITMAAGGTIPTFTGLSTAFNAYELEFDGLMPVAASDVMSLQFATGTAASPTWLTSAQHTSSLCIHSSGQASNAAPITIPNLSTTAMVLSGTVTGTSGSPVYQQMSGKIRLASMNGDTSSIMAGATWDMFHSDSNGQVTHVTGAGRRVALGDGNKTGVRVMVGTTGFSRGTMRLYGIP
jgi:hypothetical protein